MATTPYKHIVATNVVLHFQVNSMGNEEHQSLVLLHFDKHGKARTAGTNGISTTALEKQG